MPDIADIPIPSTETDGFVASESVDSRSSASPFNRLRTPSVSVTPPASSSSPHVRDTYTPATPRNATSQDGIASGIQNIRLSEPNGLSNSNGLLDAVDTVARGSDDRVASLSPEPLNSREGTPRQRHRRRRSSTGANRPHNVLEDEELPQDAFHSPSFQKAFRDAKQLMANVERVLGSSYLHNEPGSTIGRLHSEAGELARFEFPSTRTVGFVGDSGVGKSSLLNSLLDVKRLARTSNSGEACTCVVSEYHYHSNDKLDIEVDLFSMDELQVQLQSMLGSYRHYHLHRDEMDEAEKRDMKASANVARDTFRAMFRGQMTSETFLVDQPEDVVLQRFLEWAAMARPAEIDTRHSGLTTEACSGRLMELSSEPSSRDQPATWPYIRSVKVFLNAHILSRGLILVDLPGLRDLNSARRMVTERYLLRCNEIFAICNIGRAVTDEGVHQVFELARRARLSNVGIVCTRSDDIVAEEALGDWTGSRVTTIRRFLGAIATDAMDEKEVNEELGEYLADEEDLLPEEKDHQLELSRQLQSIQTRKKNHEFELKEYLVNTRNAFITAELKASYNRSIANAEINVFCVSNKDYWKMRDEPKAQSRRFLDLSGILQVRKHCISIVAKSQRRIATSYMKDKIPAFLAQVDLWVLSGARTVSEERRDALCQKLDSVERRLSRDLTLNTSAIQRLARSFDQDFAENVYARRNASSWAASAMDATNEWSGWHHSTYAAFCRNYGDWSTKAVGSHNWNEEAISKMVEDLEEPWEELCRSIEQRQRDLIDLIIRITDTAINDFAADLDDNYDSTAPLLDALSTRQQLLLDAVERANEMLEADLELLRVESLSGIRSSLFGRAVESSYNTCRQDYGGGVDARRKGVIRGAMSNAELFRKLMRDFRDAFHRKANGSQENTTTAVQAYLDVIQEIFDLVRSENVARESERDPNFRLEVERVASAGKETMQVIQGVIASQ